MRASGWLSSQRPPNDRTRLSGTIADAFINFAKYPRLMRLTIVLATWSVLLAGAVACAHASELILTHARVYPSPDAQPLDDAIIVVHDGRVASLRRASSKAAMPNPRGP